MSKRHTASRRKTYGRRQHEVHERQDRRLARVRLDVAGGDDFDAPAIDPLAFMDFRIGRLRYDELD